MQNTAFFLLSLAVQVQKWQWARVSSPPWAVLQGLSRKRVI